MTSSSDTPTRRTESRSFRYVRTLGDRPSAVHALPGEHASTIARKPTAALPFRRIAADSPPAFSAPATPSPAPPAGEGPLRATAEDVVEDVLRLDPTRDDPGPAVQDELAGHVEDEGVPGDAAQRDGAAVENDVLHTHDRGRGPAARGVDGGRALDAGEVDRTRPAGRVGGCRDGGVDLRGQVHAGQDPPHRPRATLREGGTRGQTDVARHELAARDGEVPVGPDADVPNDAAGGPGDVDLRAVELEDRAVAGTADDRVGAVAPARIDHVTLIADALAVAARRRAGVAVAVRAGRAVAREHVRLDAHRQVGIGR